MSFESPEKNTSVIRLRTLEVEVLNLWRDSGVEDYSSVVLSPEIVYLKLPVSVTGIVM